MSTLVFGLTEFAPYYGVLPQVAFQGDFVWVSFGGASEEITRAELAFARLVQELLVPAVDLKVGGGGGAEPEEDSGDGSVGEPIEETPGDGMGTSMPTPAETA